MTINGNILTPDDGMMLKKRDVYATSVTLGGDDTSDNWEEVTVAEAMAAMLPDVPGDGENLYENGGYDI